MTDLVRAWLRDNATADIDALAEVDQRLEVMQRLCDVLMAVKELRSDDESEDGTKSTDGDEDALAAALAGVEALDPEWDATVIATAHETLRGHGGS